MIDKINGLNGVHSWMEKTNEIIDELNTNTSDISTNASNISLNDIDISNLDVRLTTAESDIDSAEVRLTSLEDNTNLLNRIKTIDGAGSLIDSDKLDGQEGSYYRNASNLNAGIIPSARLSGSYNIDTTGLVKGIDIDQTYRSGVANTLIRMGSGDTTNWDGIKYDDATNNFVFKADTPYADDSYNISGVVAQRGRFLGNTDASATSTDHPLELGSGSVYAKMDGNEIYWFNGSNNGAVFYDQILQKTDSVFNYYSNDNGSDTWIVGENIKGDTSVGLTTIRGYMNRIGDQAFWSLYLVLTGFSVVPNSDSAITFRYNFGAMARADGWFQDIVHSNIHSCYGRFSGSGWDHPWFSLYASSTNGNDSNYPSHVYVEAADTLNLPSTSSNADTLRVHIHGWNVVTD